MNKRSAGLVVVSLLGLSLVAFGQSLSEIAKKEKERRSKNREDGSAVRVISEQDLAGARSENETESDSSNRASTRRRTQARRNRDSDEDVYDSDGEGLPVLKLSDSLEKRLRLFKIHKDQYISDAQEIDKEIQQKKRRIEEIDRELAALGVDGTSAAPAADFVMRVPGQEYELVAEQNELKEETQELETRKINLKAELVQKGRRAGIPPGNLRF